MVVKQHVQALKTLGGRICEQYVILLGSSIYQIKLLNVYSIDIFIFMHCWEILIKFLIILRQKNYLFYKD